MQNLEIDNIRKNANIVDIISGYVDLTIKGKNYFGVCPFHSDHSPSMSVSPERQIYKCFSCGATGNVFTFVKDIENVSFMEAVKIVAEKTHQNFTGYIKQKSPPKLSTPYEIMNLALKFYQNNLNTEKGIMAKEYLKTRNLNESVIEDFNLGLALGNEYSLNKLLLNKQYKLDTLINLGLVYQNNKEISDTFKYRIIFPIHDLEGNPVGFTGRIYENNGQAKYINSKESSIFKKGNILFNYHRAIPEIRQKKEVIIVEGNMDAIRLYSNGVKNVVALMGTSLTKEQVNIIKNMRSKIILMLDNDNAGELATYNNGNILEKEGITPFVVRLSNEKDPDEYIIKNGIEAIINNIKKPVTFLDFKLNYLKKDKDLNNTVDLASYIKESIASLKYINDDLIKKITIKKISDTYNVPLDLLEQELNKLQNLNINSEKKEKTLDKQKISKYDMSCINIIYFMLNEGVYIEKFKKELGYFRIKKYRDLANEIIYYYDLYKNISLANFITYAEEKDIYDDLMDILKKVKLEDMNINIFEESINNALIEGQKIEIKELKTKINEVLDENEKLKLANKLIELKKGCVGNG